MSRVTKRTVYERAGRFPRQVSTLGGGGALWRQFNLGGPVAAVAALTLLAAMLLTVSPEPAAAQGSHGTFERSVSLDSSNAHPRAIWSDGETMWVTNFGSTPGLGKIFAYDFASDGRSLSNSRLIRSLSKDINTTGCLTMDHANGLWSDGVIMYASDNLYDEIYAYSLVSGPSYGESRNDLMLSLPGRTDPRGVWSDGETIWAVEASDAKIYAYDLDTGARVSASDITSLDAAGNDDPAGLWSDGETVWVVDDSDAKIYAYDLDTGTRKASLDFTTLQAAGNGKPKGLWSDGETMWVSDLADDLLYAYSMPKSPALKSLDFSGIDLGAFSAGRFRYVGGAPNTVTSTTVAATATFSDSNVVITPSDADSATEGHQVSLSSGDNSIRIAVTNGSDTRTYTVTVTQVDAASVSSDATLTNVTVGDASISMTRGNFKPYHTGVAESVERVTVAAVPTDSAATVTIKPDDADSVTSGHQVNLEVGANTFTVEVESSNRLVRRTYTVIVGRATTAPFGWNAAKDFNALDDASLDASGMWFDGETMWIVDRWREKIYAYDWASRVRKPDNDITLNDVGTVYSWGRDTGNNLPEGIWSDGETMWVVDMWDKKLYAYDLGSGAYLPDRDIDGLVGSRYTHNQPSGIWSDGETFWVADSWDYKIYAYELDGGARLPARDITSLWNVENYFPHGIWSDGKTMWVYDRSVSRIFAYDLATGARVESLEFETLAVGASYYDDGHIWSDGETMWVSDQARVKLYAYNMPASAALRSLELSDVDFGAFAVGRFDYAAAVPATLTATTVTAIPAFAGSTVAITPSDADAATDGHQVSLSSGANTVAVTVTNGRDTRTYTVAVTQTSALADLTANTPATGAPSTTGTPASGQSLTAGTEDIADGDGLESVSFTYQWIRNDGVNDVNIDGATDVSYTVTDEDVGEYIKVRVSFTDDKDNGETLTSAATEEVTAASGPLTGFTLLDASTRTQPTSLPVLATLGDGGEVRLADPAGGSYAIRADVDSSATIGSVKLELSGAKARTQTESVSPYSLYGDDGDGLHGEALPVGSYTLKATAYAQGGRVRRRAGRVGGVLHCRGHQQSGHGPAHHRRNCSGGPDPDGDHLGGRRRRWADQRRVQPPVAGRRHGHPGSHQHFLRPDRRRGGQDHQGQGDLHRRRR